MGHFNHLVNFDWFLNYWIHICSLRAHYRGTLKIFCECLQTLNYGSRIEGCTLDVNYLCNDSINLIRGEMGCQKSYESNRCCCSHLGQYSLRQLPSYVCLVFYVLSVDFEFE